MFVRAASKAGIISGFFILFLTSFLSVHAEYPRAYFGRPDVYDVDMSPDGASTAILTNEATHDISVSAVWNRLDIQLNETGEVTFSDRTPERFYFWVNWTFDDIVLAQTAQWDVPNKSGKRIGYEVAIKAIDPKTGEERNVWEGEWQSGKGGLTRPYMVASSRKMREIVIRIDRDSHTDLIAVNVDTGAQRYLEKGNKRTLGWTLDENLVPRLRMDEGKRENQAFIYRKTDEGDWTLLNVYNPIENDFATVGPISDDLKVKVVFRPGQSKQAGLYLYNIETNTYEKRLFEKEGYDLSAAGTASFSGDLLYVGWYEEKLKKQWFSEDLAKIAGQIDKALRPDDNWHVSETSLDQTKWLMYISSPRRPGRYFYMNLETKKIVPVIRTRPDVKDDGVFPMKVVNYKAADGMDLIGYYIAGRGHQASPLIVMPHGGPVARDNPDYDGLAQYLAYRGYNVFQPQFRGGGGFGVEFEIAGFGEWGRKMQTDIEDGVLALIEQGLVAPTARRGVVGASYGGYAAMVAATLTPDNYQCVVSINGVSDLPTMLSSYDRSDILEKYAYDVWVQRIGNPETELDRIKAVSPYDHLDKVKAPVLLIHGTEDSIVDVSQSRNTFERMKQMGKVVMLHELQGANHQLSYDEDRAETLVVMDRFLRTCLPPR